MTTTMMTTTSTSAAAAAAFCSLLVVVATTAITSWYILGGDDEENDDVATTSSIDVDDMMTTATVATTGTASSNGSTGTGTSSRLATGRTTVKNILQRFVTKVLSMPSSKHKMQNKTWREKSFLWHKEEEEIFGHDTLPSIIQHFKDFNCDAKSTVREANQRRTLSYYLKARQAHEQSLVLGVPDHAQLVRLRQEEEANILRYSIQGTKSHRTVVIMLDPLTQHILDEARHNILAPLRYSHDLHTRGAWIPQLNMIPPSDMHVTVAIPWWWHTMLPAADNHALSQALAHRFRQALVLDFHHPFVLELERIIMLGGKALVALWRTVGERRIDPEEATTGNGVGTTSSSFISSHPPRPSFVIHDRHGNELDPMIRLRREIVHCFTTEDETIRRKPLTYHAHKQSLLDGSTIHPCLGLEEGGDELPHPTTTTHDNHNNHNNKILVQDLFTNATPSRSGGAGGGGGGVVSSHATTPAEITDDTPIIHATTVEHSTSSSSLDRKAQALKERRKKGRLIGKSNSMPEPATSTTTTTTIPTTTTKDRGGRPPLQRQPTIEFKTPGMGDGDGFIHTTLCRLSLDCLSMHDVELEPIHRLCREATAMYAGHRMIVSQFRFLETTGQGGDSNPCVQPIFDETMEAPLRVTVDATGQVTYVGCHHATTMVGGGGLPGTNMGGGGDGNNNINNNNHTINNAMGGAWSAFLQFQASSSPRLAGNSTPRINGGTGGGGGDGRDVVTDDGDKSSTSSSSMNIPDLALPPSSLDPYQYQQPVRHATIGAPPTNLFQRPRGISMGSAASTESGGTNSNNNSNISNGCSGCGSHSQGAAATTAPLSISALFDQPTA